MEAIERFIRDNRIRHGVQLVDNNPNMSDMPEGSRHFKVTLRRTGRQMTVFFSQGPAIEKEPTAADVLDCLASDSQGIENLAVDQEGHFETWASEYGYDTDSRKAERTFKVCARQATRLYNFLGNEQYDRLIENVERL